MEHYGPADALVQQCGPRGAPNRRKHRDPSQKEKMRVQMQLSRLKCSWKCVLVFLLIAGIVNLLNFFMQHHWRKEEFEEDMYEDPGPYHVAYPREYRFILDHPQKCQQHNRFVVVIVPSAPRNTEARHAIRSTWGNDSLVRHGTVLVLFLLGLPSGNDSETQQLRIHKENLQHQDLLQSNFIDSYRNLTIKTMVMLEWLKDRCPQSFYAVKADDDMLLNIRGLITMLLGHDKPPSSYITGLVWYGNVVIRDPSSKFYMPHDVYPNSVYPPYPLGMCYIMSMDLPQQILRVSKEIKPIFIEDTYIGLCIERLNITPKNPPNLEQFVVNPPKQYNRCYYANLIAVLTYSPKDLVSYWMDIHKPGSPC